MREDDSDDERYTRQVNEEALRGCHHPEDALRRGRLVPRPGSEGQEQKKGEEEAPEASPPKWRLCRSQEGFPTDSSQGLLQSDSEDDIPARTAPSHQRVGSCYRMLQSAL